MARLAKLNRLITLVNSLGDTAEGLTLDDMAEVPRANHRSARRPRGLNMIQSDLEESIENRQKRIRIPGALTSPATQPNVAEIAAPKFAAEAGRESCTRQAPVLESLLGDVRANLKLEGKSRMASELDTLAGLQHHDAMGWYAGYPVRCSSERSIGCPDPWGT